MTTTSSRFLFAAVVWTNACATEPPPSCEGRPCRLLTVAAHGPESGSSFAENGAPISCDAVLEGSRVEEGAATGPPTWQLRLDCQAVAIHLQTDPVDLRLQPLGTSAWGAPASGTSGVLQVTLTIDAATGSASPSPPFVTADFSRHVTVDATRSDGVAIHFESTIAAADFHYDENATCGAACPE